MSCNRPGEKNTIRISDTDCGFLIRIADCDTDCGLRSQGRPTLAGLRPLEHEAPGPRTGGALAQCVPLPNLIASPSSLPAGGGAAAGCARPSAFAIYHVHPGWRCVNAVRAALRSSAEASRELPAPLHRLPTSLTWPMASVEQTLFLTHHPRPNPPPLLPPHSFAIFSVQIGAFHSAAALEAAHLLRTRRSKRGCNYQVAPQGD
jgi:hypothetical protein